MTNKTSFDNIRAWLVEIHEYAQDDVVILLLGKHYNKLTGKKGEKNKKKTNERRKNIEFGFENKLLWIAKKNNQ